MFTVRETGSTFGLFEDDLCIEHLFGTEEEARAYAGQLGADTRERVQQELADLAQELEYANQLLALAKEASPR